MVNFFDTQYYNENNNVRTNNPFGVNKPAPAVPPKISKDDDNIGTFLANGITAFHEVGYENNANFFAFGSGTSASEVNAVNVKEQTQLLSAFKNAYANFSSYPSKETALKLKKAYFGDDGNKPVIDNKNVRLLYESKASKIEELINSQ